MDFSQMGKLMQLASKVDLDAVGRLSERVDLGALLQAVAQVPPDRLKTMLAALQNGHAEPAAAPAPDGDFYGFASTLTPEQADLKHRVRVAMEGLRPVVADAFTRDATPRDVLVPAFRELDAIRSIFHEDGTRRPGASVAEGMMTLEMARVDVSTATFFGVHAGLALWSVVLGGSAEQKAEWLPKMMALDTIGAFGLTEPGVGSGVAGGLKTKCRREGDGWVLEGEKKWIGNATFADFVVIWARDADSGDVRGFVVRAGTPGFTVAKIEGKIALRGVENGLITLAQCRVPDADRLQAVEGWSTVAQVLRATRVGVAWQGVGCALGAYERALAYTQQRKQFGRPIAGFQLVQSKLVEMLGHVTAGFAMCMRLSAMQDAGTMRDEHASLAKAYTAARCRETVALARELFGGNGLLLEHDVARAFLDAEAIYSYEGTHEINTLVVGRAITGHGAFV